MFERTQESGDADNEREYWRSFKYAEGVRYP